MSHNSHFIAEEETSLFPLPYDNHLQYSNQQSLVTHPHDSYPNNSNHHHSSNYFENDIHNRNTSSNNVNLNNQISNFYKSI